MALNMEICYELKKKDEYSREHTVLELCETGHDNLIESDIELDKLIDTNLTPSEFTKVSYIGDDVILTSRDIKSVPKNEYERFKNLVLKAYKTGYLNDIIQKDITLYYDSNSDYYDDLAISTLIDLFSLNSYEEVNDLLDLSAEVGTYYNALEYEYEILNQAEDVYETDIERISNGIFTCAKDNPNVEEFAYCIQSKPVSDIVIETLNSIGTYTKSEVYRIAICDGIKKYREKFIERFGSDRIKEIESQMCV